MSSPDAATLDHWIGVEVTERIVRLAERGEGDE
jgi:hypothetical protein